MILSSTFFLWVFNFFSISLIFFCFSNYNIFILFSIWIVSLNPCLHSCWNLLSDSHMLKWASDMFSLSSIKLIYILLIYEIDKRPIIFTFSVHLYYFLTHSVSVLFVIEETSLSINRTNNSKKIIKYSTPIIL